MQRARQRVSRERHGLHDEKERPPRGYRWPEEKRKTGAWGATEPQRRQATSYLCAHRAAMDRRWEVVGDMSRSRSRNEEWNHDASLSQPKIGANSSQLGRDRLSVPEVAWCWVRPATSHPHPNGLVKKKRGESFEIPPFAPLSNLTAIFSKTTRLDLCIVSSNDCSVCLPGRIQWTAWPI
jgi:hypothetical protein